MVGKELCPLSIKGIFEFVSFPFLFPLFWLAAMITLVLQHSSEVRFMEGVASEKISFVRFAEW